MSFLINALFGFFVLWIIISIAPFLFGVISFFVFIYIIYIIFRMFTIKKVANRNFNSYTYQNNETGSKNSNEDIKEDVIDVEFSESEEENI